MYILNFILNNVLLISIIKKKIEYILNKEYDFNIQPDFKNFNVEYTKI